MVYTTHFWESWGWFTSNVIIYRVYIYIYVYEIDMVSFCHCEPSHCKAH